MNITSRTEWGAHAPRAGVKTITMAARREFMIHYSGGPVGQTVRALQDWCMNGRGFLDIDYNFLIRGTTGELYEGRGWNAVGSHCTGHNRTALGICIIGTGQFTPAAVAAVRWLYEQANFNAGHPLRVLGHREAWNTSCPGDNIEHWIKTGEIITPRDLQLTRPRLRGPDVVAVQQRLNLVDHALLEDDGVYGPDTAAAVKVFQAAHQLLVDGIVGPATRAALELT